MQNVGALTALVLAIMAMSLDAPAQPLACAAIRPGETAAAVAKRISGHAQNRHEPWFQILDPATSRFVGKDQYGRIRPGWRACVLNEPAPGEVKSGAAVAAATVNAGVDTLLRAIDDLDSTLVLWAAVVLLIAVTWPAIDEYLADRQRILAAMRRFGETFIREFERPLLQPDDPAPPIKSRLRANPYHRRLEILLAPGGGRRYPNLTDHRKNVEYDVSRILQRLRGQPFVCTSLYAHQQWVVVPFQFHISSQQAGGK